MQDFKMSLIEHLSELRTRIIYAVLAITICSLVAGIFWQPLLSYITESVRKVTAPDELVIQLEDRCAQYFDHLEKQRSDLKQPNGPRAVDREGLQSCANLWALSSHLQFIHPTEGFFTLFKLCLMVGLLVSAPLVLYQIWMFVVPALFQNEKKYVGYGVFSGVALFYLGSAFAFFVVLPRTMEFLSGFGAPYLVPNYTIANYVSFMFFFVIGFGLVFELPLVLFILAKLGIVTANFLSSKRKYAIVINLTAAAIITPTPDPFTMMTMAVPMIILYEVSIWLIRWFVKKKPEAEFEGGVAPEKGA
ncbi:twin-arginine translocase subunit TatC [Candidatus Acetothermia bacterium]|nr:twin-arginine translocase subunit TatC [Candidatus Acetothermia bacterium]MBI3460861.1 twin-arginine translocase subunit TatC [Candidatus Acetothermia bacterium]MBI3660909.1 twin-arginine translocase subunit TatC [Candidatus Acetothermia bacterium]